MDACVHFIPTSLDKTPACLPGLFYSSIDCVSQVIGLGLYHVNFVQENDYPEAKVHWYQKILNQKWIYCCILDPGMDHYKKHI